MQNKTQDYNAYKHDDMDLNNIFFMLTSICKNRSNKKLGWGGGIQKEIKLYQMMIEYIYIYI